MSFHHQKEHRVNIELYMQSGIIESYALGLATLPEREEFEQLLPHYPELKEALSDFEYHLELFAIDREEPPPPGAGEEIAARLRETPAVRRAQAGNGYYRQHDAGYIHVETTDPYIRVHKSWRTWFIIFCLLSKIFMGLAIYFFVEYRHARMQILQLQQQAGKQAGVNDAGK
jgi:hypothetical protein